MPIDVAIATALTLGVIVSAANAASPQWVGGHSGLIALAVGLATFGFALSFDLSDPKRVTHRSDVAFWLHMLAAPLIVHGLFAGVIGASPRLGGEDAGLVIAVTLAFTVVALVIDRRALIVSALAYAGGAFYYLLKAFGPTTNTTALSALVLGATVLVLSVGWRWLRAQIVPRLPLRALVARLPPVRPA